MMSNLYFVFSLVTCAFGVIFNCLIQDHECIYFFLSFIVLVLTFSFVMNFWVNFCIWCEIGVQVHPFANRYPVVPHHLLQRLFSSHGVVLESCWNQLTIVVWVCFWILFSFTDLYIYSHARLYCLLYCSFAASFEIGKCESSFFNIVLFWDPCIIIRISG